MARDDMPPSRVMRMIGRGRDPRTPLVAQLLVMGVVFMAVALLVLAAYLAYWLA
jgi:hypothetical protein